MPTNLLSIMPHQDFAEGLRISDRRFPTILEIPSMKNSRIYFVVVFLSFSLSLLSSCTKSENQTLIAHPELDTKGKQLKYEIDAEFEKKGKATSQMIYDLGGLCHKYIPVDTKLSDAEIVLRAAGASTGFVPAFAITRTNKEQSSDEVAAEILLEQSQISHTSFRIVIKPSSNSVPEKQVGEIAVCELLTISM